MPCAGCFQRASASAPTTAPLFLSTLGWKKGMNSWFAIAASISARLKLGAT
jgi:hypothetical protein